MRDISEEPNTSALEIRFITYIRTLYEILVIGCLLRGAKLLILIP